MGGRVVGVGGQFPRYQRKSQIGVMIWFFDSFDLFFWFLTKGGKGFHHYFLFIPLLFSLLSVVGSVLSSFVVLSLGRTGTVCDDRFDDRLSLGFLLFYFFLFKGDYD